jgi:hypothetical protein
VSIFKPGLYPRKHELTIEEEFDRTLIRISLTCRDDMELEALVHCP